MTRKLQCPVLLLGEASFAFSAALSDKIIADDEDSDDVSCSLLATCYQSEDELLRLHVQSAGNVRLILSRAPRHRVLFGVDATRLETRSEIFSFGARTILFNLPHVGGKSDIKKNRQLLRDFFLSCSRLPGFSFDDGEEDASAEIWVTLLNGQGGTEADSPRRDWANSWQTTSMAAEGGFILVSCFPFAESPLPNYARTGYRGRDQAFQRQAEAIVHVFRKGPPTPVVRDDVETSERVCEHLGGVDYASRSYFLPTHVTRRMKAVRRWSPSHPVKKLLSELLRTATEGTDEFKNNNEDAYYSQALLSLEESKRQLSHGAGKIRLLTGSEYFVRASDRLPAIDTSSPVVDECHGPFVRSSIVQSIYSSRISDRSEVDSSSLLLHGDCYFRPTLPRLDTFVYEFLAITERTDLFISHFKKSAGVDEVDVEILQDGNDDDDDDTDTRLRPLYFDATVNFPKLWMRGIIELEKTYITNDSRRVLGFVGRFTRNKRKFVVIDVTALAMRRMHDLADTRAFFAFGERLSLSPPVWNHCLSFWECRDFDERTFVDVALTFCDDLLQRVNLKDKYEAEDGRVSRCYDFVYRSVDRPLTRSVCSYIQLALRSFLQRRIGIEPR